MESGVEGASPSCGRRLTPGAIVWNSSAPGKMKRACPVLALGPASAGGLDFAHGRTAAGHEGRATELVVRPPWNPVRVLVRGSALQGARVEVVGEGLTVGLVARTRQVRICSSICTSIRPPCRAPDSSHCDTVGHDRGAVRYRGALSPEAGFQGFSTDDVIYLAMPDRFRDGDAANNDPAVSRGLFDRGKARYYHGGDFTGIVEKLPYLKELGITALWLNPWYDNVNHLNEKERYDNLPITDYHGYGAVDFYGVEEHSGAGRPRALVEAAHRLGIKVIQDQVANHRGPEHPWVADPPTPTWFNGTEAKHAANTWQTWTLQDPHASPQTRRETLDGWFIDILPDLNQQDDEVALASSRTRCGGWVCSASTASVRTRGPTCRGRSGSAGWRP